MRETKIERTARFFARMSELGFSYSEAQSLRRIEMTLQRWAELECGTGDDRVSISVERDEDTGKPFERRQFMGYGGKWQDIRTPCHDREAGALKRLARIMAGHPDLWSYHQGDPRGCALYIGRKSDVNGHDIRQVYNRGFAVCI